MLSVSLVVPTYQAEPYLSRLFAAVAQQIPSLRDVLIIDSSSSDRTCEIAQTYGARAVQIDKATFDHGGTRTLAGKTHCRGDILVYLTQDALPVSDDAIARLIAPLRHDPRCGAVFGRQVPYPDATPYARHLRAFNYPPTSFVREYADRAQYGVKVAFCSNSFAAYRRSALEAVGWFASGLGMAEDLHVCARMLKRGFTIRYVSDAAVYHSHNYTLRQDFQRYFDIGAFFRKESWLRDDFGSPGGEGLKFVRSEVTFLVGEGLPWLIPASLLRAGAKLLGYKLGHYYQWLPKGILRQVSMHTS